MAIVFVRSLPNISWPAEIVRKKPQQFYKSYSRGDYADITYNLRMKLTTGETITVERKFRGKLSDFENSIQRSILLDG